MIIRSIILENFQCYYGIKEFKFTKGLNIVLGANSHGKSKLFDAIQWLFNGEIEEDGIKFNQRNLISKKALFETQQGETIDVSTSMLVEKDGAEIQIIRTYAVTKIGKEEVRIKEDFKGYQTIKNREKELVSGDRILEYIFPVSLRRYSLFKGERSLNIFDPSRNPDALKNLVNALSQFRSYDRYILLAKELFESSERSVERLAQSYSKTKKKYKIAIANRDKKRLEKSKIKENIRKLETNLRIVTTKMDDTVGILEKNETIRKLNKEINLIESKSISLSKIINNATEYPKFLFDDLWILNQIIPIYETFGEKVKLLSKEKRKIETKFQIERGKREGKKELIAEISKTNTPLSLNTPSVDIMEEMLNEEICKFCNREAIKGSEAYNYMQMRLNDFLKSIEPEIIEEEEDIVFKNNFIEEFRDINKRLLLVSPKIKNIENNIIENIDFVDERKRELEELNNELDIINGEKEKLLSRYSVGEQDLMQTAAAITKYSSDMRVYEESLRRENQKFKVKDEELQQLEIEINKYNTEDVPKSFVIKKDILKDIYRIIKDTKERKYNQFIEELKKKANYYYSKLGKASQGYTGIIDIYKLRDDNIQVIAIDEKTNNNVTNTLSSSTITSLHLSILMAISNLTSDKLSDSLPVIFDAPISDFDHPRSLEFFRIAKTTFEQSIVMMKNYVQQSESDSGKYYIDDEFKEINSNVAYWVKLDEGINPKDLVTVDSKIERLI